MLEDPARCVHCGGNLVKDGGERKCLQCGRTWKNLQERHQFYEEHRFEILKDIAELGRAAATKKWQIPGGTITQLLKSWLHEQIPAPVPAPTPPAGNHLPELPIFSNDWPSEVQVAWLQTYQALKQPK